MSKVIHSIKLEIPGGGATPGAKLASLSSKGIKAIDFCKDFNEKTKDKQGQIMRALVQQFENKSYQTIIKNTPTPILLKKMANLSKGSSVPNRDKVASLSQSQIQEIATIKLGDTNAFTVEAAMKAIEGTCRSMGITVN